MCLLNLITNIENDHNPNNNNKKWNNRWAVSSVASKSTQHTWPKTLGHHVLRRREHTQEGWMNSCVHNGVSALMLPLLLLLAAKFRQQTKSFCQRAKNARVHAPTPANGWNRTAAVPNRVGGAEELGRGACCHACVWVLGVCSRRSCVARIVSPRVLCLRLCVCSVCDYALCILRAKIMDLDHEQALARAPLRLARVRGALKRFDLVRFSLDYAPVRTTTQPDGSLPLCRRAPASAAATVAASVIDQSSETFQPFLD